MVVNKDIILKIYKSLLNGSLSYADADRWAWEMMQLFDDDKLNFEPEEDEGILWELIQYLYGIDIPSMTDRAKTAREKIEIEEFLKKKNIEF
jgi:hypothetical protein